MRKEGDEAMVVSQPSGIQQAIKLIESKRMAAVKLFITTNDINDRNTAEKYCRECVDVQYELRTIKSRVDRLMKAF